MSIILRDDIDETPAPEPAPIKSNGDLLTIALLVLLAAAVAYLLYTKSKDQ